MKHNENEKNFALSKLENEKRQGKDGAGYVRSLIEIEISLCVWRQRRIILLN